MSPAMMTGTGTVALLGLAVVASAGRLLWRREAAGRTAVRVAFSLAGAAALYLTLFPPALPVGGETLLVATAGAPREVAADGARLVALPEATVLGAERVPDLATALRRYPQVARLVVVGRGLDARDRDAAAGLPLTFRAAAVPRGLVRLSAPAPVAPGAAVAVTGAVQGLAGGSVALRDPAGQRVDRVRPDRDGGFVLAGAARGAGSAPFAVELRDARGRVVETAPVTVTVRAEPALRVLIAGAPSPETKYLRRWTSDAGFAARSRLAAGGGVELGDPGAALTPAALAAADVVVVDERGWQAARGALLAAAARGLGVVVRLSGPPGAELRRDLAGLGLRVGGGPTPVAVRLPPAAVDAEALAALAGPGETAALDEPAPELARWPAVVGPSAVAAVADAEGGLIAGWGARGLGRVAVWTLADSYALVLAGRGATYDDWWSQTVSAVARPRARFAPVLPAIVRAGERVVVCGLRGAVSATGPDGRAAQLQVGADGCAAYWPRAVGTYRLRQGAGVASFAVLASGALPAQAAAETAAATRALAAATPAAADIAGERRGPAWPWFLLWLAVSALGWVIERRPAWLSAIGRRARRGDRP